MPNHGATHPCADLMENWGQQRVKLLRAVSLCRHRQSLGQPSTECIWLCWSPMGCYRHPIEKTKSLLWNLSSPPGTHLSEHWHCACYWGWLFLGRIQSTVTREQWWKSMWWFMGCRWHSCFFLPEAKAWQTWKLVTLTPSSLGGSMVFNSPTLWIMHGAAFIVHFSALCTLWSFPLCFVLLFFFCHGCYLLSFLLPAAGSNVFCWEVWLLVPKCFVQCLLAVPYQVWWEDLLQVQTQAVISWCLSSVWPDGLVQELALLPGVTQTHIN